MKWHISDVARLMKSTVVQENGCWNWVASRNRYGYGQFRIKGKTLTASRFSYIVFNNHVPPSDMAVDHICRNRLCVNPEHLRMISRVENVLIGMGSSAMRKRATHCKRGHPLSGDNLRIRANGRWRICRACDREYTRARKKNEQSRPTN